MAEQPALLLEEFQDIEENGHGTEPEKESKAKPKSKKKTKTDRTVEELHNVVPGKMTDSEKKKYIQTMREVVSEIEASRDAYMQNAQSAYEKCNFYETKYNRLKTKATQLVSFQKRCMANAHESIIMAGTLEEEGF